MQRDVKAQTQSTRFFKLQVLSSDELQGGKEAYVEFRVWFKAIGQKGPDTGAASHKAPMQTITEKSKFEKVDGRWLYLEAVSIDQTSYDFPES